MPNIAKPIFPILKMVFRMLTSCIKVNFINSDMNAANLFSPEKIPRAGLRCPPRAQHILRKKLHTLLKVIRMNTKARRKDFSNQ